jgi:hypothetical protein
VSNCTLAGRVEGESESSQTNVSPRAALGVRKFGWRLEGLRLFFLPLGMNTKSTSTWFALVNPVFFRLCLASVVSGTFVSA